MHDGGHQDHVQFVQNWISENIPADVKNNTARPKTCAIKGKSSNLPSNCGNCGGPVNPKKLEWFDSSTAVCNYCGCVISHE
jgi:hypothetical protein